MKTIIAIWGTSGIGKSDTIISVCNKLSESLKPDYKDYYGKDIDAEFEKKDNKRIGISSIGDPDSHQGALLRKHAEANCDIIICASRTKGETTENIRAIAKQYSYEIIWTSNFHNPTENILKGLDLNNLFADSIISLIDQL